MNDADYTHQIANLRDWILDTQSHTATADLHARLLFSSVSDYDEIRAKAKEVLDHQWVDGDTFCVPCELDIVSELVEMIKNLKK